MKRPEITEEKVVPLYETKYIKLADVQYEEGKHYYVVSRKDIKEMAMLKSAEAQKDQLPDAVTIYTVVKVKGQEDRLLLQYEYRYPIGEFMMSPPAGLIDDEDKNNPNAVLDTAARELAEETGYKMGPADSLKLVNPLVYSTPGFTDESNALVCAVLNVPGLDVFNNNGAVGAECFDGFVFLTRDEALKVIKDGRDPRGNRYPLYAWAALAYFVLGEYDNE